MINKNLKTELKLSKPQQDIIERVLNEIFIENTEVGLFFYLYVMKFGLIVYGKPEIFKTDSEFDRSVKIAVEEYKKEIEKKFSNIPKQ